MNRFEILEKAEDIQKPPLKASWMERQQYYDFTDRLDELYTLAYSLTLRSKIKKEISENYLTKDEEQFSESIVEYCECDITMFEHRNIHKTNLQPLIELYVRQELNKIASYTLKLEL